MTAPNPDRPNTDPPGPALPGPENLLANLPATLPAELVTILAENRHVRIERIVSTGHASPEGFWYDQEEHEWVLLLQGAATLGFEHGREVSLKPGDCLLIPAHQRHRVDWTSGEEATVWLAVFFGGN